MAEIWANVKTILATEVTGEPYADIFVYYDTEPDCSNGSGILVKGDVEVHPI